MHSHKVLKIPTSSPSLQKTLHEELGISNVLAQVLLNRGIKTADDAGKFLSTNIDSLLSPHSFCDMHKSVSLIKKAAANKEKVLIFSDYDVDGITSLVVLKNTLSKMGMEVLHYLPHRVKEGYGLNENIYPIVKQENVKLLITADCGINSHAEIDQLRKNNIEVIITDHHEPADSGLPLASCIINPKVEGCGYKYRDLAGVGVAYKLCQAVSGDLLLDDLDLVSLGTIADVVPLTGENRILVKEGLKRIPQSKRVGLQALMEVSGIKDAKFTPSFVSFILGPRLNASGRMDTAEIALNLLMAKDESEAITLAKTIDAYNRTRQKIENKILEEAEAIINKEVNFKEHKVIVVGKEDWHPGVLGIVASKLSDRFYRPTIVLSLTENLCKGSGRSIKKFHLFEALNECKDLLATFGGHSHAAGLVIERKCIDDFRNHINRLAHEKLMLEDLLPSLDIDMELALSDLSEATVRELERLEPFGTANPEPLFYTRGLNLKAEPRIMGRNTLKFWVTDGTFNLQAIGFGMGNLAESLKSAQSFDLVYTPRIDNWQDQGTILLEAKEIFFK